MSLTNARLAYMKAACVLSVTEYDNQGAKDVLALISRLEAAEELLNKIIDPQGQWMPRTQKYVDTWKKAAGK